MNWHILTYFWLITIEWSQSILYHTGWCLYFNFSNNMNRWAQTQYHSLRASSIKTAMVYCRMCWWRARSHALQTPPHTLCQLQVICLAGCSNTWDIRRRSANPAATAHRMRQTHLWCSHAYTRRLKDTRVRQRKTRENKATKYKSDC